MSLQYKLLKDVESRRKNLVEFIVEFINSPNVMTGGDNSYSIQRGDNLLQLEVEDTGAVIVGYNGLELDCIPSEYSSEIRQAIKNKKIQIVEMLICKEI